MVRHDCERSPSVGIPYCVKDSMESGKLRGITRYSESAAAYGNHMSAKSAFR
jgi:hypothetical protein